MDITPLIPQGKKIIQRYGKDVLTIGDQQYHSNIIVLPDTVFTLPTKTLSQLNQDDFHHITENAKYIDLLLIGCGITQQQLSPEWRQHLRAHHMIVETMDTPAACRTFNVLLSEERNVAALLILPCA